MTTLSCHITDCHTWKSLSDFLHITHLNLNNSQNLKTLNRIYIYIYVYYILYIIYYIYIYIYIYIYTLLYKTYLDKFILQKGRLKVLFLVSHWAAIWKNASFWLAEKTLWIYFHRINKLNVFAGRLPIEN